MLDLFNDVLQISFISAVVSVFVIIGRFFLKGVPRWVTCLLWAVLAVRLICPVFPESTFSLVPSFAVENEIKDASSMVDVNYAPDYALSPEEFDLTNSSNRKSHNSESTLSAGDKAMQISSYVWCVGAVLLLMYNGFLYIRIKLRFRDAIIYKDNVLQSEKVSSPFVLGLIKPKIFIPFHLDDKTIKQVVLHEQAHIKRLDHIWKPFGFVLLCMHWFNPLMWISYFLFCRDVEVSCDEKVIKNYSIKMKKSYAMALLKCRSTSVTLSAAPLAFGEVGVDVRIKKALKYKKHRLVVEIFGILFSLLFFVCFLTNPATVVETYAVNHVADITPDANIDDSTEYKEIPVEPTTVPSTEPIPESVEPEQQNDVANNSDDEYVNDRSVEYNWDIEDKRVVVRNNFSSYTPLVNQHKDDVNISSDNDKANDDNNDIKIDSNRTVTAYQSSETIEQINDAIDLSSRTGHR